MGVRLAGNESFNSDSSPYAEGHCNALEAAINGFMEGVKEFVYTVYDGGWNSLFVGYGSCKRNKWMEV